MLHIQLLGNFRVVYDEELVTGVHTERLRSLLAYLVLHREAPQPRHHLAMRFWPDSTEAQARTNLRNLLYQMRNALPEAGDFVHADTQTVQWQPGATFRLDVADFENAVARAERANNQTTMRASLEKAMDLYGGDLLPSCYDEWIAPERERLRQAFIEASDRLVRLLEDQRDYRTAIRYGRRQLQHDPLREATYRHLIRLYTVSGDRAEAVHVYETCVATLERELGVGPSPATREAYEQLLRTDVAARPTHNLPSPPTPLIGRAAEVDTVQQLLCQDDVRLVTLVGPAGVGKTRLGLQVAAGLMDEFEDGVFFVPLTPVSDPDLAPSAIAQTLGLREMANRPLVENLKEFLRDRHLLLLLDNFEQVISAASLVADLLAACPKLKVLVTSREVLRLHAEHQFTVPPLAAPEPGSLPRTETDAVPVVSQYPAVQLFLHRVQAVNPDFTISEQNARAVAEICARLDGLPLAIELAAARIKLLSPQTMLTRLEDRFELLAGEMRDWPARHQTLREAIAWSYDLLGEDTKAIFRRLAVFVRGCTLEAAEAVCNAAGDLESNVLDGASSLMDKSLVRRETRADRDPRFLMLETIREYGLERLAASGEATPVRNAHAEYYLALAEEAELELRGAQQSIRLNQLAAEHDNLRAALRWAIDDGAAETALRLAGALGRFWYVRGHLSEGRRWLEEALAHHSSAPAPVRAKALRSAGRLAFFQCDYATARALLEASLEIQRRLEDEPAIAMLLNNLGMVAYVQGDYATAHSLYDESLAIERQLDEEWGIGATLRNLGMVAQSQGDHVTAHARCAESLDIFRKLSDRWRIADSLSFLGAVARYQGDYTRARELYEESLDIFRELEHKRGIAMSLYRLGDVARVQGENTVARILFDGGLTRFRELGDPIAIAYLLEGFGHLAAAGGRPARAVRLFTAAEGTRQVAGAPLSPVDRPEYQRSLTAARTRLDEDAFAAAWGEGRAMTLEQAIVYAQKKPPYA
ncbi:MAG: putative HTH-type transcriptional regulator [Anaerolineales bacterium]|nr:putative HTH-type transcriptional regulator [Anaerolineales bacterium]